MHTQKDLDSIDIEHDQDGQLAQAAAQEIARYYFPPWALIKNVDSDRALTVITYEVIADRAYLQPIARMLLANCSDRQLSVYLNAPSEKSFSSERTWGGGTRCTRRKHSRPAKAGVPSSISGA